MTPSRSTPTSPALQFTPVSPVAPNFLPLKGTAFQQYSLCISKYVEECGAGNSTGGNTTAPDADGCVWAPLVYYRGLDSYNRYLAQNEESMVSLLLAEYGNRSK